MKTMTATFKSVKYPERTFAYVRHMGPYMGDTALFASLFEQVTTWMKKKDLFMPDTEAISIYHDDPKHVPVDQQRISVGFTVPIEAEGAGDVRLMKIPTGKFAVGSFVIDANEYADAWEAMMEYMKENNLMFLNGLMYESYKNDPSKHPQGKHLVDICVAIK